MMYDGALPNFKGMNEDQCGRGRRSDLRDDMEG